MTKPVAYRFRESNQTYSFIDSRFIGANPLQGQPLYTSEQLHKRVKMTQAEFDEWEQLDFENNIFGLLGQLLDNVLEPDYPNLTNRVYGSNGGDIEDNIKQLELCELWTKYNPDQPEETIEIIPNMKWFVRSKKATTNGEYRWLENDQSDNMVPTYSLSVSSFNSRAFETKEEAEKWENPLTEAVLLPVEEN